MWFQRQNGRKPRSPTADLNFHGGAQPVYITLSAARTKSSSPDLTIHVSSSHSRLFLYSLVSKKSLPSRPPHHHRSILIRQIRHQLIQQLSQLSITRILPNPRKVRGPHTTLRTEGTNQISMPALEIAIRILLFRKRVLTGKFHTDVLILIQTHRIVSRQRRDG